MNRSSTLLRLPGACKIFEEKLSAANRDRPQLKAALDFLRAGPRFVVWKLDRLARSLKQLIETVEICWNGKSVSVSDQNLDQRPLAAYHFHVFGALPIRALDHRERTTAALPPPEPGRVGGRPRYLSEDDILVAKALLKDGRLTIAEIADRLDVASSTLYKHLPRPRSTITLQDPA